MAKNKYYNYKLLSIIVILLLIFLGMFFWNKETPFLDDDFGMSGLTFKQIISSGIGDYFNWNGRFFGQTFSRLILMRGSTMAGLISSFSFTMMIFLILVITNSVSKSNINVFKSIFIIFFVFLFAPGFSTVFIWKAGVGNYLMPIVVDLVFLCLMIKPLKLHWLSYVLVGVFGIIAGWGNENTSGAVLLISLLLIFKTYKADNYFSKRLIIGSIFCALGFITLILSPGSKKRELLTDSKYVKMNLFERISNGLLRQSNYFINHLYIIVFLSIVLIVTIIVLRYHNNFAVDWNGIIFIIGGAAAIIVMWISPEGMDTARTYLGAFIFLLIGMFSLLPMAPDNYNIKTLYVLLFALTCLVTFFTVANGSFEAISFNTMLKERYSYISSRKNKTSTIKVQPLNFEYNRYSLSDVYFELTDNPNNFPNTCYEHGLKVKSVVVKK